MFKNYIKITFRNLIKYKGFTLINIVGLAIGITCCMLILLFVKDELSYDKDNEKVDRIYKMTMDVALNQTETMQAVTCAPLAETMIREFPEVESAVRIRNTGFPVLRYKEKVFSEERFFTADSTLFGIFTIPMVKGDPKTALNKPLSVVLTESMAKKYFGDEEPIGKVINSDNRTDYKVTGVVKDCPENSHWHFDFIASLAGRADSRRTIWLNNNFHTYILLREGSSWKNLNNKLNPALEKFWIPQILQLTGTSWEQLAKTGSRYKYQLMPLKDIHLYSNYDYDIEKNSDIAYVYIFSLIAAGILCIACFNFMNLSTARAIRRAKEVGIRKTVGSTFSQLITQFLSESMVLCSVSVFFSIILVNLLLPVLNEISGKTIHLSFADNLYLIPVFLLFIIIIGLMAGIYPAFIMASFKPISVLGGRLKASSKGKTLRSGLVIVQFSISIILLVGTFIVKDQLSYIQNKKLGYNKEQVVIIHKVDDIGNNIGAFKEELKKNLNILNASNSTAIPGSKDYNNNAHTLSMSGAEGYRLLMTYIADYDFVDTYQMEMAQGRFYQRDRMIDTVNSVIINEAAAKSLGFTEPIGKQIIEPDNPPRPYTVIGVIKDFNFESLHNNIRPMLLHLFRPQGFGKYLSVRIRPENVQSTLNYMKSTWAKFAGYQAFEYSFHDEDFAKQYRSEQRTDKLFTIFSLLGIFVACLGLLGLVAHTVERRTKEIGIRKALGSTTQSIIVLLLKEFTKWILIANLIAWPAAYFLMNRWLEGFAYKTGMSIWVFLFSGILTVLIALGTIFYQSLKAARANPVNSLKYE
jgi:putative ABC transport system permease protein